MPDEWASPYTSDGAAAWLFCVASYVAEREKGGGSEALFFYSQGVGVFFVLPQMLVKGILWLIGNTI